MKRKSAKSTWNQKVHGNKRPHTKRVKKSPRKRGRARPKKPPLAVGQR